jgi:MFS family permease
MDDETTEGVEQPGAVGPAAPVAPLAPAEPVATPAAPVPATPAPAPTQAQVSNMPMWVLGLVIMIDQIDQNIVRGVVTPLKEEFGVGDAAIGLLLSAFVLVNGLITVPAGYLADRWNRTRTIGHTVVGWSGITALTAAAPNFASLVAIRGALGFGQAITEPSCASLLADYYPAEKRGRAFSVQQVLLFVGFGLGVGLGGVVGATLGWRWAFVIVGTPGVVIALAVYRLREPRRGHADRLHLGLATDDDHDGVEDEKVPLFEEGFGTFFRKLVEGLRADARTILAIPTMRYALVGVSALLFTVTALGAALPQFYERELEIDKGLAEVLVGALVIMGGAPGVILGGRVADRYATRIRGARMAIPAYCILIGMSLFTLSWLHLPTAVVFALQVLGFFVVALAVPALRAGLSDAVPANLRGAGFGFFNLASVVFGQAAAPIVVFALSGAFDDNLRTAFLIVTPPVYLGGLMLLRARDHLDADAARIFEAILKAMQDQQADETRDR